MKLSRGIAVSAAAVVVCAVAGATAFASAGANSAPKHTASVADVGTLDWAVGGIVPTWDTYKDDGGGFLPPLQAAYDSLVRENPNGTFSPGLASSFKFTTPSTFVMTIRQGVTFDDGTPLTPAAVVENLQRAKTVVGPKTTQLAGMKSVTAQGNTVTVKMKSADPDLPLDFSQVLGMMISPKALADPSSLQTTPDGVGPYILDQSATVANTTYTFRRNPNFWDASYAAGFPTIVFHIASSQSAILAGVQSGQYAAGGISYQQVAAAKSAGMGVLSEPNFFEGLWIRDLSGKSYKPFANPLVREAMNYAVNRKALQPLIGGGSPTASVFPAGTPGYNAAANRVYSYNPAKARALLKQAGYPHGFSFNCVGDTYFGAYELALVAELGKVGINVKLNDVSNSVWAADLFDTKVPAMIWYYNPADTFYDASSIYGPAGGFNPFHNKFPTVVSLLAKAASATNKATANKYYQQMAMATVMEADSGVITNFGDSYYAYNPKLVSNLQFTVLEAAPSPRGLKP